MERTAELVPERWQPGAGPAVEVRDLFKRYGGTAAVDGASFVVERGEILGLIGPNGSGKTTTVECVQGLRRPDAGTIRVLGLDPLTARAALRGRVGAQLQESGLPDRLRVGEALDVFAALTPRAVDPRELATRWGLGEKLGTAFGALSGGQRQRLFVALALLGHPEVVFLDEMTAGLDPASRRTAWQLVEDVRAEGTTVVLVTHFMDEAERLCDRVAVMARGRIVALGTPAELAAARGGSTVVRFTAPGDVSFLSDVRGVRSIGRRGATVEVVGSGAVLALVAAALVERGIVPADLRAETPSLEDAYLALVGEAVA